MARPKKGRETPISLRVPPALMERLKYVAAKLGMSDAEVIRLCAGIGLEHLKRINYDLSGAILDASNAEAEKDRKSNGPTGHGSSAAA